MGREGKAIFVCVCVCVFNCMHAFDRNALDIYRTQCMQWKITDLFIDRPTCV